MTAGYAETGPAGPEDRAPHEPGTGPLPPRMDGPPTGGYPAVPAPYPRTSSFPPVSAPPPARARRSPWLAVVVGVLAVLVVVQGGFLVYLNGQLSDAKHKLSTIGPNDREEITGLKSRLNALEHEQANSMNAATVAAAVLPSVFRIDVPEGSATAFAIAKPSSGGTDMLTNYHVVEGLWKAGKRDASISHDSQRFPVHVVRVDQDNDLALLHADAKFPTISVATAQVQPGTSVVLIGAPLGLAQSVTGGVVSAIRNDVPGDAGKTFIQFDAAINFGNSGGPVVNAQKQVVGVAAAKANGSEGIGLAVPISVACQSFSGIC
jgi:putative serine protease PepD